MVKYLVVFLLLFSGFTYSSECAKWEYANLGYTTSSNGLEPEYEKFGYFVLWSNPKGLSTWQNNKLMMSGVTDKSMKEFFQIKSHDYISILNSLGNKGWESYSYDLYRRTEHEKNHSWQFKRCKS